jgi:heavy metal sensor kinase
MTFLPLRRVGTRLTLWYVCLLAAVLAFSWGLTMFLLYWQSINQMDRYAIQDAETVEGLLFPEPGGNIGLHEDYHNHPESKLVLERLLEVRSEDGTVLYKNDRLGVRTLGGGIQQGEGVGGYSPRTEHLSDGTAVRIVSRRHILQGRPILLRVGYSEESLRAFLERLLAATLLALPVILAAAGFAGYGLARRALAPLEQMARRAGEITPSSLAERLPVRNTGDELDQLAGVINSMLARLDQSFEQLRRFTSDASHELRTPLAAIRSVGEVGMQTDGTREHYREVVGSMLEEVNRLTRLVDSLLTMSRADAGQLQLRPSVFPVMELARESSQLFEVLLEEKNQHLTISGDENVRVEGDRLFLRQALMNLIHNAIKFSPLGGTIAVRIRAEEPSRVVVEISDSGPGIPPEHAPRVFDRFYRVDQSRSRDEGGTGLGLSIARWAIEVNGGTIGLRKSSTAGSTFQILLPAVSSRG